MEKKRKKRGGDAHQSHHVRPCQIKGAIHVAGFVSNVFEELGEGGGSWEVERQSLVDCLGVGGVPNNTQHSGFLGSVLVLRQTVHACVFISTLLSCTAASKRVELCLVTQILLEQLLAVQQTSFQVA